MRTIIIERNSSQREQVSPPMQKLLPGVLRLLLGIFFLLVSCLFLNPVVVFTIAISLCLITYAYKTFKSFHELSFTLDGELVDKESLENFRIEYEHE